jgi:hypothetical protein
MNVGTSKQAGGDRVSTISLLGCSTSVALTMGPTDKEEEGDNKDKRRRPYGQVFSPCRRTSLVRTRNGSSGRFEFLSHCIVNPRELNVWL